MKGNPLILLAGAVLWLGTLVGAYQLGHRQTPGQTTADTTADTTASAATANTRVAASSRGGADSMGMRGQRTTERPATVKQLFSQFKSLMRPGLMQNPVMMMRALAIMDKLRPEDVPAALLEIEAMKDPQAKMMTYMAVLGKWAEQDGPAAMKYAEDHAKDLGATGAVLKMSVVPIWAEKDPDAVWAWYQSHKDNDSGGMFGGNQMMLSSIFSSLMTNDPDTAFKRLGELDQGARFMALSGMSQAAMFDETKRQDMMERIKTLPDASERSQARQMLISQWVMFAPDEAAAWVGKQPANEQKEMRDTVGQSFMMSDPQKGAAFIMQGATAEEKPALYAKVVGSWGAMNPEAAATWLAQQGDGPELDQGRMALAISYGGKNSAAAMATVRAITDDTQRFTAAGMVYDKCKRADAAAADKALDNAGLTADQVQQIRDRAGK